MNYWHKQFSPDEHIYGKEANAFIRQFHEQYIVSGKALAVADAEGRNAVYLAEQGPDVTSWDYTQAELDKTKQLAKERKVSVNNVTNSWCFSISSSC